MRNKGFPLSKIFPKALWRAWDTLTSKEREDYELYYENKDNTRVDKLIDAKRNT